VQLLIAFDLLIQQHLTEIAIAAETSQLAKLAWWQGGDPEAARNWMSLLWWLCAVGKWAALALAVIALAGFFFEAGREEIRE
jgi:hypothetical protein